MAETQTSSSTQVITTVLSLALQALSAKAVILLSMVMTFGLFAWAMADKTPISSITAGVFAVLVFLPVLWRQHARENG